MKLKAFLGARIVLGLIFTIFGLNGFFHFIPMPPMSDAMNGFMGALMATGYMFPVIKVIEIACGVLLLANMYVPLAMLLLSPIVVNILLAHIFLDQGGLPMALVITGLMLFLSCGYCETFKSVLQRKNDLPNS